MRAVICFAVSNIEHVKREGARAIYGPWMTSSVGQVSARQLYGPNDIKRPKLNARANFPCGNWRRALGKWERPAICQAVNDIERPEKWVHTAILWTINDIEPPTSERVR